MISIGEAKRVSRRPTAAVLAATAHHEAGHAVAAVLKGVPFRQVTIVPAGTSAGHIHLKPGRGIEQTHKRAIVALSGEAAQRQFSPRSVRQHHGGTDRGAVVAYALDYAGSSEQADLLVRLWSVQARDLILARWPAVCRVAHALIGAGRLDYADCRRLVFG